LLSPVKGVDNWLRVDFSLLSFGSVLSKVIRVDASISVVIPYYNGSKFIANTLDSVFRQELAPLEIIVVDDGSSNEEAQALEVFQNRIRIIRQSNTGVSGARNAGISMAQGSWIAFLDQDDLWEPDKLRRQWIYIQQHPECKAVHTAVRCINQNGQEVIHHKHSLVFEDFLNAHPNPSYLSSTMISKDGLLLAGLFNPTLPFSQDLECFLRCSRHFPFHYLEEVLTTRLNHSDNLSSNYLGVWLENTRIVRFYASQYKSDFEYRQRLYGLHMEYALLAISRRNFGGLNNIVNECVRDGFSRTVFVCHVAGHMVRSKFRKPGLKELQTA
jgi:glycosyltransferase involved in cell wall biosynthesis